MIIIYVVYKYDIMIITSLNPCYMIISHVHLVGFQRQSLQVKKMRPCPPGARRRPCCWAWSPGYAGVPKGGLLRNTLAIVCLRLFFHINGIINGLLMDY